MGLLIFTKPLPLLYDWKWVPDLIVQLHKKFQQPVVILVDEYYKPILDALREPEVAKANRDFLRGFYATIKDYDAHIRFSFLTGVSKFSKVSLFSGPNNLEDITLAPDFSTLCGYTDHDIKSGYAYAPYSSLESVIEANKEAYYLALSRTQKTLNSERPEWQHWLVFFLKSLKKQKDNLLKKVERERYFLEAMPALSADILELAKEMGRVTTNEIVMATKAKRATVRRRLEELVRSQLIRQHGKGKGTWYSLR